jgi:hypothetical protein
VPHRLFHVEHLPVSGALLRGESGRGCVLHDAPVLDHQHPLEAQGLADIVGDAEHRGPAPVLPRAGEQLAAGAAIQAATRLIQDGQAHALSMHRAAQPDPLPLAAGHQPAALAKHGLHPLGEPLQDPVQVGPFEHGAHGRVVLLVAVAEVG